MSRCNGYRNDCALKDVLRAGNDLNGRVAAYIKVAYLEVVAVLVAAKPHDASHFHVLNIVSQYLKAFDL